MFIASPTVRWSPSARRWPRRRRASTVCGGGPSPAGCPGAPSTSGPRWTGCEECRHCSGSASTAGVWEPWPPGGPSDASVLKTRKHLVVWALWLSFCCFNLSGQRWPLPCRWLWAQRRKPDWYCRGRGTSCTSREGLTPPGEDESLFQWDSTQMGGMEGQQTSQLHLA